MIKAIWMMKPADGLSLAECQQHWFEVHGRHHVSATHKLIDYRQNHTLVPAFEGTVATHAGASICSFHDLAHMDEAMRTPAWAAASEDGRQGVRGGPLFAMPIDLAVGLEEVVSDDGGTTPFSVKIIHAMSRKAGMAVADARRQWEQAGRLIEDLPGLRRHTRNHGLAEARKRPGVNRDDWAELWFDDHDAVRTVLGGGAWRDYSDAIFGPSGPFEKATLCCVVARERDMLAGAS